MISSIPHQSKFYAINITKFRQNNMLNKIVALALPLAKTTMVVLNNSLYRSVIAPTSIFQHELITRVLSNSIITITRVCFIRMKITNPTVCCVN